mmetsp:Transcript_14660/g.47164  ORF Transcript_14660/g.47164 Transcript_14660/m.47164 type:complete len:353 (+) Transcript_14660:74-1132(+)
MRSVLSLSTASAILLGAFFVRASALPNKDVHMAEYKARNHSWPPRPEEYKPSTPGWRKLKERRFRQIKAMPWTEWKYSGWVRTVHTALTCPNFTEHGWAVTRAPEHVLDMLTRSLHSGLDSGFLPEEHPFTIGLNSEFGQQPQLAIQPPLYVHQKELSWRLLDELKPLLEVWPGTKLEGVSAYGLRVYRNNSVLGMHLDLSHSHVVSSILHVGHDVNWPLVIEDFDGTTHEVFLEPGDQLFYESSKVMHGRPRRFEGSWYASVFLHYRPVDWRSEIDEDAMYRIPPGWRETKPLDEGLDELKVNGVMFLEPGCENLWCGLRHAEQWRGPAGLAQLGKAVSTGSVSTLGVNVL